MANPAQGLAIGGQELRDGLRVGRHGLLQKFRA